MEQAPIAGLAGQRVVVTGATGFIGRRVVPELRAAGAEVTVIARGGSGGRLPPGVRWVTGDLGRASGLAGARTERLGASTMVASSASRSPARKAAETGPQPGMPSRSATPGLPRSRSISTTLVCGCRARASDRCTATAVPPAPGVTGTDTAFTVAKQLGSQTVTATGRYTVLFDNDQGGVV